MEDERAFLAPAFLKHLEPKITNMPEQHIGVVLSLVEKIEGTLLAVRTRVTFWNRQRTVREGSGLSVLLHGLVGQTRLSQTRFPFPYLSVGKKTTMFFPRHRVAIRQKTSLKS